MEYSESYNFTISTTAVIASLVFLIFPWFPQYFIYVLNEALSLLGSLYLSTMFSFKGGSFPLTLKFSTFFFSH